MIILKLPMILVPLFLKCLQTEKQIYIALISYILALLPAILIFPMFIPPSYMYYKIFTEKRNKLFGILHSLTSSHKSSLMGKDISWPDDPLVGKTDT
jgi:hypothetical protein